MIAQPMAQLSNMLGTADETNLDQPVPGTDRGDEVGILATHAQDLRQRLGAAAEAAKNANTEELALYKEQSAQFDALKRSQAYIEFELDGTIRDANDAFLGATGYTRDEIVGTPSPYVCRPCLCGEP